MDHERLKRYSEKIELLRQRAEKIRGWTREKDIESLRGKIKDKLAVYKAFQEATEAAMDLCAMILKDSGKNVEDDYSNLNKLQEEEIITGEIAEVLKESKGLRNRLIHEYNSLEVGTALESVKRLTPRVDEFAQEVAEWLEKNS